MRSDVESGETGEKKDKDQESWNWQSWRGERVAHKDHEVRDNVVAEEVCEGNKKFALKFTLKRSNITRTECGTDQPTNTELSLGQDRGWPV